MSDHPLSEEQWKQIKAAVAANQKIEAIKLYREFTGQGLKESKEAIDKLSDEMNPGTVGQAKSSIGCFSVILFAVAAVLVTFVQASLPRYLMH